MSEIHLRVAQKQEQSIIRSMVWRARINPIGIKWSRFTVAVKDGDLEDMYDVPFEVVEEAYPDIQWGGRS